MGNKSWWERSPRPHVPKTLLGNSEIQTARGGYGTLAERLDAIPTFDTFWEGTVPTGQTRVMLEFTGINHHPDTNGSLLYPVRINLDTDSVDTGAGLSVVNTGQSDNIYLDVAGKSTGETTPTGLGIDINKGSGGGENNDEFKGFGIQIYDHSTTDGGVNNAHMIYLWKKGNMNTAHPMIELAGNKNAIRAIVSPDVGGYDAQAPIIALLRSDTGATRWQFTAGGDLVYIENDSGVRWVPNSGNEIALKLVKASNRLDWRLGSGGMRFLNNVATIAHFEYTDNGQFAIRQSGAAVALVVEGIGTIQALTIDNGNADGGNLTFASQGFTSWDVDNASGVLRFIRSGTVHANFSTAGLFTVQSGLTSVGAIIGQSTLNLTGLATLSGGATVTGSVTASTNFDVTGDFRTLRGGSYRTGGTNVWFASTNNPLATAARNIGTTTVDVTSWSVPAGSKAVYVRAYGKVATANDGNSIIVRKQGNADGPVIVRMPVAAFYGESIGWVPINTSNNQIEFVVVGANTTASGLVFIGYCP
jgi:hypothetical protein